MRDTKTYDDNVGHAVKRLYHLMDQHFNDALRPYGIARSQWYLLYYLYQFSGATQKELQSALRVEAATVTAAVNALEKKGWITRQRHEVDHRLKVISLTTDGHALWQSLPDPIIAVRTHMLKGISPSEEKRARVILNKAIQNLEKVI